MDRKRQKLSMLRMAVVGVLVAAGCTGCGKPMLYHFKHYKGPFAAISKSNTTYFHSSQTGKIIEKDRCAKYCEPGCYGYEETCWTPWPDECKGTCPPMQAEPVAQYGMPMPYEGQVISDGAMMMDQSVMPPNPVYQEVPAVQPSNTVTPSVPDVPAAPAPGEETRLPALRVPSLPADVESAVPSPSDSTSTTTFPRTAAPSYDIKRSVIANPMVQRAQPTSRVPAVREQAPRVASASPKPIVKAEAKPLPLSPSRVASIVEQELTPLPATKVAQLPEKIKPVLKSANKPLSLGEAKTSGPVASSRKAKSLTEKLRVRAKKAAKRVVTDTAVMKLPTTPEPVPARLQLGGDNVSIQIVEKVQPKKGLNTAQVVLPKAKDTSESQVRFRSSDLASKLKNSKPVNVNRTKTTKPRVTKPHAAVKVSPKTESPSVTETSVVKVKTAKTGPKKSKATLNVSTGKSSVIRFANTKAGKEVSRLSASQGSTVLRFANDR